MDYERRIQLLIHCVFPVVVNAVGVVGERREAKQQDGIRRHLAGELRFAVNDVSCG